MKNPNTKKLVEKLKALDKEEFQEMLAELIQHRSIKEGRKRYIEFANGALIQIRDDEVNDYLGRLFKHKSKMKGIAAQLSESINNNQKNYIHQFSFKDGKIVDSKFMVSSSCVDIQKLNEDLENYFCKNSESRKDFSKKELTKEDFINMIKSTSPNYDLHPEFECRKIGEFIGGFASVWIWNEDTLNKLNLEELNSLYEKTKNSWSNKY